MLREEWERREELELLQEEQRRVLEEETKKRQEFERQQEEKDAQLRGKIFVSFIWPQQILILEQVLGFIYAWISS